MAWHHQRPLPVTVIAAVYIVMGAVGFAYHFKDWVAAPGNFEDIAIELIRLLALVTGVFLLRARNWARWVAVAWIAFHVVLSAFHNLAEFAMHAIFCIVIAWALFRPAATSYFHPVAPLAE